MRRSGGKPPRTKEVGRGVGQGYFALGAGGCGFESHPVHLGAGSSMVRTPNVLGRMFRPAVFEVGGMKWETRKWEK
jgi:hypothetical protein